MQSSTTHQNITNKNTPNKQRKISYKTSTEAKIKEMTFLNGFILHLPQSRGLPLEFHVVPHQLLNPITQTPKDSV